MAVDVPLVATSVVYIIFNAAFFLLVKQQDRISVPKCDECEPTPYKAFFLQAWVANLSEFIAFPLYVLLEWRGTQRGEYHASRTWWERIWSVLTREAPATVSDGTRRVNCDWNQPAPLGFVLRAGRIDPPPVPAHLPPAMESAPPRPRVPAHYWALPALVGLAGSICRYAATSLIPVSLVSMLMGLLVVNVAAFSFWFLKRRYVLVPHLAGVVVVTLGVFLIGLSPLLASDGEGEGGEGGEGGEVAGASRASTAAGLVLTMITVASYAFNNVQHDYMLTHYAATPLEVIALDSLASFVTLLLAAPLVQLTGLEDVSGSLAQLRRSPFLLWSTVANVVLHAVPQLLQYVLIGRGGALVYNLVVQLLSGAIWAAELALGWQSFRGLQMVGYALTFGGTLLYADRPPLRAWLGLAPPLAELEAAQRERERARILSRFLEGDGNAWTGAWWRAWFACPRSDGDPTHLLGLRHSEIDVG